MNLQLVGKRALVTGASAGIGAAIAEVLARGEHACWCMAGISSESMPLLTGLFRRAAKQYL
jgi:NAD(P)-dependent dehydrogenase (short-subunit alcohol dehydrogenase family)